MMVDRTQEDINQDAQIAHLKDRVVYLGKLVDKMDQKLDALMPVVEVLGPVAKFMDRLERIALKLESLL